MAERRKNRKKREAELPPDSGKPSKDEYSVAKYLRQNLPEKKTMFLGHKVEYFIASKAIDCLLDSPWATKSATNEVCFTHRESVVSYMDRMLQHKFFHRAKKNVVNKETTIKKKKGTEESVESSKDNKKSKSIEDTEDKNKQKEKSEEKSKKKQKSKEKAKEEKNKEKSKEEKNKDKAKEEKSKDKAKEEKSKDKAKEEKSQKSKDKAKEEKTQKSKDKAKEEKTQKSKDKAKEEKNKDKGKGDGKSKEKATVEEKEDDEKEKEDTKDADNSEKKKDKKKFKLDMHLEQLFLDGSEVYVWIYDPIPLRTWINGMLMVVGAVLLCLFPLWPQVIRHYIYYLSIAAALFLVFIIGLAIIRLVVFVIVWAFTLGKHHLWLLPNLTEDVGFFESFWPLYQYEYKGPKKEAIKEAEEEDEKSESSSDQEKKEDQVEDEDNNSESEKDSGDEAKNSNGDNDFELLNAEDEEEEEIPKKES